MTVRDSRPSLFPRFAEIQQQHSHLASLNQELRSMCDALLAEPPSPLRPELEPRALVAEWSRELSRHFGAEEALSYFGAVAAERPDFSFRIGELRAEHAMMLEAIEALTLLTQDLALSDATHADTAGKRRELALGTRDLQQRFELHERAETALLQEYFDALSKGDL